MIYGYIRVSTRRQAVRGNSLEEQQEVLRGYGCQEIFQDVFTGSEMERPGFEALAAKVQAGDTIIVTKLDRLGRTAIEGYNTVKRLVDGGVTVNILNMGIVDISTPVGKATLQIMLAFAEMEREMIVERTQGGRAYKRATDPEYREGRPPLPRMQVQAALEDLERYSYREAAARHGISESSLYRAARKAGYSKVRQ